MPLPVSVPNLNVQKPTKLLGYTAVSVLERTSSPSVKPGVPSVLPLGRLFCIVALFGQPWLPSAKRSSVRFLFNVRSLVGRSADCGKRRAASQLREKTEEAASLLCLE